MTPPTDIFDRAARRRRRDRAAAGYHEHDFLRATMLDGILDRLSSVKRTFGEVLDLGAFDACLDIPGARIARADAGHVFESETDTEVLTHLVEEGMDLGLSFQEAFRRMGRMVTAEVLAANGCELAAGTEPPASEHMGVDLGALAGGEPQGVTVTDDAEALFKASDAVIDFTVPDATLAHAALAGESGTALIVGTTGLKQAHMDALNKASENTIIVQAANMSAGVNVLLGLVEQAAGLLGDDYDIEISEIHHRMKVDAPSGTALPPHEG